MIDINTLHIGSHVLIGGERREVFGLGCGRVSYLPHPVSSISESVLAEEVEPIPITEELLRELGLLKMEEHGSVSVWMNRNIRIDIIGERMTAMVGIDCISPVRYLHELEAFLYLTTKTELIKE